MEATVNDNTQDRWQIALFDESEQMQESRHVRRPVTYDDGPYLTTILSSHGFCVQLFLRDCGLSSLPYKLKQHADPLPQLEKKVKQDLAKEHHAQEALHSNVANSEQVSSAQSNEQRNCTSKLTE